MEYKKQKTYKAVFEIACNDLIHSDYELKCEYSGIMCRQEKDGATIHVPFFDEIITIHLPQFNFKSSKGSNVTLVTKIIILHYMNRASGAPLTGEKVSYGDIPECMHYEPVFSKRVLKPIQSAFGSNSHAFREAGTALDGKEEGYGDASFTLFALPKVPITFIIWEGNEEFPASAKTLFDSSITEYLGLEDIVVTAKLASARILKSARKQHMEGAEYDL